MLAFAAATSPNAVSRVICDAAYDSAAAVDSAEPNNTFSHAVKTVSPARSSIHDNAGSAALIGGGDGVSPDALWTPGPNPRMIAATAMPTTSSVITVSVPLAADFSARSSVMRTVIPKNPAAVNVSHIGKAGERQSWSSDVAQAQFMRDVPQCSTKCIQRSECLFLRTQLAQNGSANGAFGRQASGIRSARPCAVFFRKCRADFPWPPVRKPRSSF